MKLINFFLILIIVIADIAISSIEAILLQNELEKYDNQDHDQVVESFSLQNYDINEHDKHRFNLFQSLRRKKQPRRLKCNKFPTVCRAKGSPGPRCCKKKCVNLLTDQRNCGKCGKKCKYNKICCNGKCVNPSYNKRHCGGCNNSCSDGGLCAFGLCSYA